MVAALTQVAQELMAKRYLARDAAGEIVETVDGLFKRVALALAEPERNHNLHDPVSGDRDHFAQQFYLLMSSLRFLPNSPTLMNAGREGTLSACFTFHVDDSLDAIFDVGQLASKVLKYGGGVGYGLSRLRPKGSPISTTGGKARGPVAALGYYQSIAAFVEQAGKRDGAQMAILSVDHPDILDFIHAKDKDPRALNTFNISVAMTDQFMRRMEVGDPEAHKLFNTLSRSAWTTGDPGLYFIDRAERDNPTPHLGRLESTNPCGEVPLLHAEACNLGSLNLAAFFNDETQEFDWGDFSLSARLAVRLLDNAITVNRFPDPVIHEAVQRTRKIGLGVMGLADLFALMDLHYDSDAAVTMSANIASTLRKAADEASIELAHERGSYPALVGDAHMRNATRTCIAPTGSIANLAGCSTGIEPHYALEYTRMMGDGQTFTIREPVLDRLKVGGVWPHTALNIPAYWHLAHQAAWQNHIDLAVSKTINLPNNTHPDEVRAVYESAWKLGCKGVTVFRDGCRGEQVLMAKQTAGADRMPQEGEQGALDPAPNIYIVGPARRKLPQDRNSITHKFTVDNVEGYITVGLYPDGHPGEMFLNISREGSTIRGWADLAATFTSIMLQHGIAVDLIAEKLRHTRFEPAGITGEKDIPFATSIPDYIGHWLQQRFGGNTTTVSPVDNGQVCPLCGGMVVMQEGCLRCKACDWSRC